MIENTVVMEQKTTKEEAVWDVDFRPANGSRSISIKIYNPKTQTLWRIHVTKQVARMIAQRLLDFVESPYADGVPEVSQ